MLSFGCFDECWRGADALLSTGEGRSTELERGVRFGTIDEFYLRRTGE
jgi:hypothetical protein